MMTVVIMAAFVMSLIATGLLRRWAMSRRLLDVPNARSSHHAPTPRGGGLAIVVSFIGGLLALVALGHVETTIAAALIGGPLAVAIVGFVDDRRHVPARWRLLVHFAGAAWSLAWLGWTPSLALGGAPVDLGWGGHLLAVITLVWALNLYNFMDGIDGIAGVETCTVCLGAVVLQASAPESGGWIIPGLLAAATLGFLVWNFPPATIFMGDVGSGFLGLVMGVLALLASNRSPTWLWSWTILLAVFVGDATLTVLRRLTRRERVYEAHRSHAYQHAARRLGSHRPVTLAIAGINLVWLLPLAILVGRGALTPIVGLAAAYLPIVALAWWLGAGTHGKRSEPVVRMR